MDRDPIPTILIVDDHPVVRAGLAHALERQGQFDICEAASYQAAVDLFLAGSPFDLALIDYNLGSGNGIDCALALASISPQVTMAMITLEEDLRLIESARKAGISAFINKSEPLDQIASLLIELISNKNQPFRLLLSGMRSQRSFAHGQRLTATEALILVEIADGSTTRQIAQRRFCSEATIKSHLTSIYRKLGVRNRTGAIASVRNDEQRRGALSQESPHRRS